MKVFFITGEASGDSLGSSLIHEFKRRYGDSVECVGVGGDKMAVAGLDVLLPMDQISVIGIWEVIPKIPQLIKINKAIIEEIEKRQPDVVITIDFPDFNFMLSKKLKKRGIFKGKIIHYVAPSVWAWRPGRAKKISGFLDGILCLFPMEPDFFKPFNLPAAFIGHPLVEQDVDQGDSEDFRKVNEVAEHNKILGLFFGSRESEFKNLGETIKSSAKLISEFEKDVIVLAPTLPDLEFHIQNILDGIGIPAIVSTATAYKWSAFKSCDVAIATSGTVALELAYVGIPHVVIYKVNPITAFILKFLIKVKTVHLANILLGSAVVPELLQGKCTKENITREVLKLFKSKELRDKQIESFKTLREILGANDTKTPSEKAVDFIETIVKPV